MSNRQTVVMSPDEAFDVLVDLLHEDVLIEANEETKIAGKLVCVALNKDYIEFNVEGATGSTIPQAIFDAGVTITLL